MDYKNKRLTWNGEKLVTRFVKNTVALMNAIPAALVADGDACFVLENEKLYVCAGGAWAAYVGDRGDPGDDGREIELQKSATHIQWRYQGDAAWVNLVTLSDIKGDKGDTGATGGTGATGAQGAQGPAGPNTVSSSTTTSGFTNGHMLYNNNGVVGAKALTATDVSAVPVNTAVLLTGAQTVAGVKTFSDAPIVPTAAKNTNNAAAASTAFVRAERAPTALSIAVASWVASTTYSGYAFQATITVSGLAASDRVDVALDPASAIIAIAAEMMPASASQANGFVLYAKTKPTAALSGNYVVNKGA